MTLIATSLMSGNSVLEPNSLEREERKRPNTLTVLEVCDKHVCEAESNVIRRHADCLPPIVLVRPNALKDLFVS